MYYFISIIISVIVVFGGCFSQKKKNVTLHGYGSDAGEHGAFGLTEAAYCSDSNALNYSSVAPNNDILEISCAYQFTYCRAVVEYFTTFNGSPWTSEMDMMCHNTIENGMRVSRCNTGGNGLFDGNFPFEPFSTDHWLSIVESESAFLAKFPIEYTTIQGDQIRVTGDRDLVTCRNFSNMYNDKPLFEGPKPYEECTSCTPDPSIEIVTKISGPIKSTKEIATCSVSGASTINPLSGEFQESVLIVGTGLNLQYSTRKIKSKNGDLFEIPISIVPDESYTNTLEHVKIELEVAGRKLKVPSEFQPDSEGYRVSIYWDGKDLFRRVVPGEVKAKLRMRFGFIPNIRVPGSEGEFAFGATPNENNPTLTPSQVSLYYVDREFDITVGANSYDQKIGGWNVDTYHQFDPDNYILNKGDGDRQQLVKTSATRIVVNGQFTIPDQSGELIYIFDTLGRHQQTLDSRTGGVLNSFTHDSEGYLTEIADAYGNITRLNRNEQKYVTSITGPFSATTNLEYNESGHLIRVSDPLDRVHSFGYSDINGSQLLTSYMKPSGHSSSFTYDAKGRVITDVDREGGVRKFDYFTTKKGIASVYTSPEDRVTTFANYISKLKQPVQVVNLPNGRHLSYVMLDAKTLGYSDTFDTWKSLRSGVDERFYAQETNYYTIEEFPISLYTRSRKFDSPTLNDQSNPMSVNSLIRGTEIEGFGTQKEIYNASNRSSTITSTSGKSLSVVYNEKGDPESYVLGVLLPIQLTYDSAGRIESAIQGDRTTTFRYDDFGYLSKVIDALGGETMIINDPAGRPSQIRFSDLTGVALSYDSEDNITGIAVPNGNTYTSAFDRLDREIASYFPSVGNDSYSMMNTYNKESQILSHTKPNTSQLTWQYGADGRLSSIQTPEGEYTISYDPNRGFISKLSSPGSSQVEVLQDWNGSLLTREYWFIDGIPLGGVRYSYAASFYSNNTDGQISEMSFLGHDLAYSLNLEGEAIRVGDVIYTREPTTGLLIGTSLNSISSAHEYNGFGELIESTYSKESTQLMAFNYSRDKLGRITSQTIINRLGAATTTNYTYDIRGRLQSEQTDSNSAITYSYDTNGNRLNDAAIYDAQDRLIENSTSLFFYDKSGFLSEKRRKIDQQSVFYIYDSFGRLLKVDDRVTGKVVEYVVDALGRRVAKKLNGVFTHGWIYKDALKPVAELSYNAGTWQRSKAYIYGSSSYSPDAFIADDGTYYRIISDHLGSPRLVVRGNSGEVVQELNYDSWGNVIADSNPGFVTIGYAGGLYDPDTGLVRFGARDYDPSIGRWLDRDPIGFAGGVNWYAYVENDPVNNVDPTGEDMLDDKGTINTGQIRSIKKVLESNKPNPAIDVINKVPFGKLSIDTSKKIFKNIPLPPNGIDVGGVVNGANKGSFFCRFSKEF